VAHATRANLGFLLAKASQRWNERLADGFAGEGFPEVRPAYGSVLVPLLEEDGLRMGEIAQRARLSKQTVTTLVRLCEREGFVVRSPDPADGRARIVTLTPKARRFEPAAERVLARLERETIAALGTRQAAETRRALATMAELES
jgi:DNA-binding MarR family transcriptional regulator